jgi:hypothetical protein
MGASSFLSLNCCAPSRCYRDGIPCKRSPAGIGVSGNQGAIWETRRRQPIDKRSSSANARIFPSEAISFRHAAMRQEKFLPSPDESCWEAEDSPHAIWKEIESPAAPSSLEPVPGAGKSSQGSPTFFR